VTDRMVFAWQEAERSEMTRRIPVSSGMSMRWWWFLAGVNLVAGIVLGVVAFRQWTLDNDWKGTTGTVIDVRRSGSGNDVDYDTTSRFWDSDGFQFEFRSQHGSSNTQEGHEVAIRYDPRSPSGARTNADTQEARTLVLMLCLTGLGFGVCSALRAFGRIEPSN